jgi:hypothetical protein
MYMPYVSMNMDDEEEVLSEIEQRDEHEDDDLLNYLFFGSCSFFCYFFD